MQLSVMLSKTKRRGVCRLVESMHADAIYRVEIVCWFLASVGPLSDQRVVSVSKRLHESLAWAGTVGAVDSGGGIVLPLMTPMDR